MGRLDLETPQVQLRVPQVHLLPLVVREVAEDRVVDGGRGALEARPRGGEAGGALAGWQYLAAQRAALGAGDLDAPRAAGPSGTSS